MSQNRVWKWAMEASCSSSFREYKRPTAMAFSSGTRLGPYEIVSPAGLRR